MIQYYICKVLRLKKTIPVGQMALDYQQSPALAEILRPFVISKLLGPARVRGIQRRYKLMLWDSHADGNTSQEQIVRDSRRNICELYGHTQRQKLILKLLKGVCFDFTDTDDVNSFAVKLICYRYSCVHILSTDCYTSVGRVEVERKLWMGGDGSETGCMGAGF